MNSKLRLLTLALFFVHTGISLLFAQQLPEDWHLLDMKSHGYYGISAGRAYEEVLKGKTPKPVIVAVIDSGTETFHEDLAAAIWTNPREKAGNGIDDDGNGYADDIYGWNFIGGTAGNVEFDNLEITRDYRILRSRFAGKTAAQISQAEKKDYDEYLAVSKSYTNRLAEAKAQLEQFDQIDAIVKMARETIDKEMGKTDYTVDELMAYQPESDYTSSLKEIVVALLVEDLQAQIDEAKEHFFNSVNYAYNLDFDPRHLVGDDYSNPRERNYGNNHVDGPRAEHGTHVAGIIGALHNDLGINGVCNSVQMMVVRCVPDGDERDKDVANSIRYAADNGARIINMSFGKSRSPQKDVVDEAVKYAESKGVLLIHAAGNDSKNIDKSKNFPSKHYQDGKSCSTWITVGASGPDDGQLMASFSNYGKKNVDVFAPGVEILSTEPGNKYKRESGTSMAAPVTTGVAATLMAYYPELTAAEVKMIILKSSAKYKNKLVYMPDDNPEDKKIPTSRLKRVCATGGIVNLYNAVKMAEQYSSKKKRQ